MEFDTEKKNGLQSRSNPRERNSSGQASLTPPVYQLNSDEEKEPTDEEIQEKVARIRKNYQKMIYNARSIGADVAADNLEEFINGNISEKILSVEWLRSFGPVQNAEDRIKGNFVNKTLTKAAKKMEDGDNIIESDYWVGDIKTYDFLSELAYASGASKSQGDGIFNLSKNKNVVNISGEVIINWYDAYDWEEGKSFWIPGSGSISDDDGIFLKKHGGAKEFMMRSAWKFKYKGKYDSENGTFTESAWTFVGTVAPDESLSQLPRPNEDGPGGGTEDGSDDEVDTGRGRRRNREKYRRDRDTRRDREENRR